MINFQNIIDNGVTICSSGSTGESKPFFQPSHKIKSANKVAISIQGLTNQSKIYTVAKLDHAGGLLMQTIPGYEIGATIQIKTFNAYQFVKEIRDYTHTVITPKHIKAIMLTKGFSKLDLTGITVVTGSDPVTWDVIEAFVSKGCKLITTWGMSEIGPMAITHTFQSTEEVDRIKKICPKNATILGSNNHCEYKIENNELIVKGDICIFNDWYYTKDTVVEKEGILFFTGRKNLLVDFDNPKKG